MPRTVGCDLVGSVEFGVDAIAFDQPMEAIATSTAALVEVAENDGALSWHHGHPSPHSA